MKKTSGLKLYITLTICTAFIFCFSYFGHAVYGKVFNAKDVFAENTKIGSVNISGLTFEEAVSRLVEEEDNWYKNTKISLHYKEKEAVLKLDLYEFLNDKTIGNVQAGNEIPLIVDLDQKALSNILTKISPELTSSDFQIEQLTQDLLTYASQLSNGSHKIKLQDYFSHIQEDEIIAESTTSVENENNMLEKWITTIPEIDIMPHSQLSILKIVEDNGLEALDEKTLSMISSAVYKTVLSTNFDITERHIGRELPTYAEIGYEAKIDKSKKMDFIVTNPNDQKYTLQFKYMDNLLYVSLKGSKFIYQYNVSVEDKELFKPKKIVQYDAKLPFGQVRTEVAGKEGILVKVFREISGETGEQLKKEMISEDFYPPVHEIIVQSLTKKDDEGTNNNSNQISPKASVEELANDQSNDSDASKQDDHSSQSASESENSEDEQNSSSNGNGAESDIGGKPDQTKK